MSFEQQQQQQGVEELANRLNQMNVYSSNINPNTLEGGQQHYCHHTNNRLAGSDLTNIHQQMNISCSQDADQEMDLGGGGNDSQENDHQISLNDQPHQNQNNQYMNNRSENILLATNVDSSVFSDKLNQAKFESLFLNYDNQVTFRYLKSFRRVRLDFSDSNKASLARENLSQFKINDTICKCYIAQVIRPQFSSSAHQANANQESCPSSKNSNNNNNNYGNNLNECYHLSTNQHLNIPKLTKQFLISPPASPPVGWEPVNEGSPCIDVQLLSAMANLVPGKVHEIHQGNESQPGIYVEVCEDPQFVSQQAGAATTTTTTTTKRPQIPKTPLPMKSSF